ncbi:protein of unknown function [Burkholderia multivorans]
MNPVICTCPNEQEDSAWEFSILSILELRAAYVDASRIALCPVVLAGLSESSALSGLSPIVHPPTKNS